MGSRGLREDLVHPRESFLPEPFVEAQPIEGPSERRSSYRVEVLPTLLADRHHPRVLEHPKLLRDGRLRHFGPLHELGDRAFACAQGLEEMPP